MKSILVLATLVMLAVSACGSAAAPAAASPSPLGSSTNQPATLPSGTGASSPALVPVHACFSGTSGAHVATWYALEKGLFKKYGLAVDLISIDSGTKAMTAILAGSVQICQIGAASVVNAVVAGQDAVLIAGFFDTYPAFLMVKPEIKTMQDLKGKALAISSPGSSTDAGTRLLLKAYQLVPDKDVALIAVGDEGARIASMAAGQVSGSLVVAPFNQIALQKGYTQLVDMGKLGIPYEYIGIATSRKYMQANPTVVMNFMKAIVESIATAKKDPDGVKAVLAKYLLLDPVKDAAALDDTYQSMVVNNLKSIPDPSMPAIQSLLDNLQEQNPNAAQFKPEQVVDLTILKGLESSGFISNLGK